MDENFTLKRLGIIFFGIVFFFLLVPVGKYVLDGIIGKAHGREYTKLMNIINNTLPIDAVYNSISGNGNRYVDPIHGFFEVQPPSDCQVIPKLKETTMEIPPDSPHAGEVVPCSRVTFKISDGSSISVVSRKTFVHTLSEDSLREFNMKLNRMYPKRGGVYYSRRITVNGVSGTEHIAWGPSKYITHLVKYKKEGLDHTIAFVCTKAVFEERDKTFLLFLCSFQGLKPEGALDQVEMKVFEPNELSKAAGVNVAVIVDGVVITENQLEAEIEKIVTKRPPAYVGKNREQIRRQVLDGMIARSLIDEKMKAANIVATEEEVLARIKEIAAQQKLSLDEFKEMLQTRGMNFDEWKRQFELRIRYQKLIESKMGDQINVTETDARNYYSANIEQFQVPEQVRVSQIRITVDSNDLNTDPNQAKAKALAKAQDLLKQIKEGADFAELAKATGGYPSAPRGGDLGFRPRGFWDPTFEKVAFDLKIGQTSDIVETRFGYHIIKVTDRKEAGVTPFEQAKENIIKRLKQKKQGPLITKYVESLKARAKIVYPPGKEPPL